MNHDTWLIDDWIGESKAPNQVESVTVDGLHSTTTDYNSKSCETEKIVMNVDRLVSPALIAR